MVDGPFWEADSRSADQEIPRLLWNPKVNYTPAHRWTLKTVESVALCGMS